MWTRILQAAKQSMKYGGSSNLLFSWYFWCFGLMGSHKTELGDKAEGQEHILQKFLL
jgi:hypothetical protein